MTMNCISSNEAQISIYIIYMMLLSATNLCLCQHQLVVYGPILEQVQCKMLLGAAAGGGGGGVGLQSVV